MRTLISTLLLISTGAFAPSFQFPVGHYGTELSAINRRQLLGSGIISLSTILVGSSPSFADVADGTQLPDGAAQFSRLLKVKADIPNVKKRLGENPADIDKKEWTNIGLFLRRIYAEADDMKSIGSSLSSDKKKAVDELTEQLRKYSKAGEASINVQDATALTTILDKCSALFSDFLDLLSDVPDEI